MGLIDNIKRQILTYLELRAIELFDSDILFREGTELNLNGLKDEHVAYTSKISSTEMALSFELSSFLFEYSIIEKPKLVLDLGSGFSSYIFRKYAKDNIEVKVFSVDDDIKWLQKTRNYLVSHDLSTKNLFSLEEFMAETNLKKFDLILLDLNFVEKRKDYLDYAIKLLSENGLLILDDAHKIEYLREIKKVTQDKVGTLYSIRKQTLDSFGRFSLVYRLGSKC